MTTPTTLDTIKARIEETVLNSMGAMFPPEEFKALIDKSIEKFFAQTESFSLRQGATEYWRTAKIPDSLKFTVSPFDAIVWKKVFEITQQVVDRYFQNEKAAIEEGLLKALESDSVFQGRVSSNVAMMAVGIQAKQTNMAILAATEATKMQTTNVMRQCGFPNFHYNS